MRNISKLLVALLFVSASATGVFAEEISKATSETNEKIWSLEDCLEFGLKNHPKVIMADSDVKSAQASLLNTKAGFDPKLSASASLSRSKTQRKGDATGLPHSNSQSESLSLSKKLYDSGRFSLQKGQSRESLKAAQRDRETTLISLAANIKTMFFKAQQAQALLEVKLETLDGYEKHLKKVESFVEVGTHAPFDITKAQVNVANARVDLISGQSSLREALVNLGNAIGVNQALQIQGFESNKVEEHNELSKSELLKVAMERPEVKSAEARLNSSRLKIKENKLSHKPTLNISSGYSWSQTHTPQDHSWNVGLSLSWSLFDGGSTKAAIDSAKASYEKSKASLDNLKLNIDKEIENNINKIVECVQRYEANEVLVQQATEGLELAEGRYDSGLGSPLEITDARVDYAKAKGNLINAYFEYLIARTNLEMTLGKMPMECSKNKSIDIELENGEQK